LSGNQFLVFWNLHHTAKLPNTRVIWNKNQVIWCSCQKRMWLKVLLFQNHQNHAINVRIIPTIKSFHRKQKLVRLFPVSEAKSYEWELLFFMRKLHTSIKNLKNLS